MATNNCGGLSSSFVFKTTLNTLLLNSQNQNTNIGNMGSINITFINNKMLLNYTCRIYSVYMCINLLNFLADKMWHLKSCT